MNTIITLPSKIKWEDYEKELDKVKNFEENMFFKVPTKPKQLNIGDKCYLVHQGFVKGWMQVMGIWKIEFDCTTTGKKWPAGIYIARSGPFHELKTPIPMKGFQGYRYAPIEWDDLEIK